MATVSLEEAQARLVELIESLQPGEELTIMQGGLPIARLRKTDDVAGPCKAGSYAKPGFWMAPDFDGPLDDASDYTK